MNRVLLLCLALVLTWVGGVSGQVETRVDLEWLTRPR